VIREDGGAPFQILDHSLAIRLQVLDQPAASDAALRTLIRALVQQPFDLGAGPLVRAHLVSRSASAHVLVLSLHHLICDGSSAVILLRSLFDALDAILAGAILAGAGAAAAISPASFLDFVAWEAELLASDRGRAQRAYWADQLAGELPSPDALLGARAPAEPATEAAGSCVVELDARVSAQVRRFAAAHRTTAASVFLAAFGQLLQRLTRQSQAVVLTPVVHRPEPRFESLIGYFTNVVAVRIGDAAARPFADAVRAVELTIADALDHRAYPFPLVIRDLEAHRRERMADRFPFLYAYQSFLGPGDQVAERAAYHAEPFDGVYQAWAFALALEIFHRDETFLIHLGFDPGRCDAATGRRIAADYLALLEQALAGPTAPEPAPAHAPVPAAWNATAVTYDRPHTLDRLFRDQVARTPDATAVVFGATRLSYRELDDRASALAHLLVELGAGPDRLVGVCLYRSVEMVVALVGVIRAGAAYVPVDPDYPGPRARAIAAHTPIVLTSSAVPGEIQAVLGAQGRRVVALDRPWPAVAGELAAAVAVEPHHLAYVMFTSGSTGAPKGVMIEHRAVCNRILWGQACYPLGPADRVLQKTPFSFDISVWELFGTLTSGACLVVAPPGVHRDPEQLLDLIARERITVLHFVASMLGIFLECPGVEAKTASVRRVISGGEALSRDVQRRFFERMSCELQNLYGPTEAAIDVTHWMCREDDDRVPIGRPIANTQIHILDETGRPTPIDVPGELHIGGKNLARGYLGQPALTDERFVRHPLAPDGARLYRTGDLARWRPDGVIEYLGRLDHQVKIRGYRIECGEIEHALLDHPAVGQAVVLAAGDAAHRHLVAYCVPRPGGGLPDPQQLRGHLRATLPDYMIPARFVAVDALPLSANGKLDRARLAQLPVAPEPAAAFEAPATDVERRLAAIWCDVLAVERVGRRDNFFERGGDSILAAALVARARQHPLALVLQDVFEHQTIAELAALLERVDVVRRVLAPAGDRSDDLEQVSF
jgi:amino acid adenylation domain-containing protein